MNRLNAWASLNWVTGLFLSLLFLFSSALFTTSSVAELNPEQQTPIQTIHILGIHSYSPDYPWTKNQHLGFVETINRQEGINFHVSAEYMDTKLLTFTEAYQQQMLELLKNKYAQHRPDMVYVSDDNALTFARQYVATLYQDVPIFFSGINDFTVMEKLDRSQFTGVFEKKDAVRNIALLKQLQPTATNINIIGDGSETFAAIRDEIEKDLSKNNFKLETNYIVEKDIGQIVSQIKASDGYPILLTTIGKIQNESHQLMSLKLIIERIRENSRQLILTMEDAYMLPGVQGGYVTDAKRQGSAAANLALEWLSGKSVESIALLTDSPNDYIFNETALDSIGMSVPTDYLGKARIISPLPDFIDRHRSTLISIIVILSGFLLFTAFLLMMNMGDRYE